MENEKLGQEPAFPEKYQYGSEDQFIGYRDGMSRRFYAACAVEDDFREFTPSVGDKIMNRPRPPVDSEDYLQWLAEASAKWRYMKADELLRQENL